MIEFPEKNGGELDEAELDGMAERELGDILDADDEDQDDEDESEDDGGDGTRERDRGSDDYNGNRGEEAFPTPPADIHESIERLDALLATTEDEDKIRAGMGIRLALGMAQELKKGQPLGSETADLVSDWLIKYGQENVDAAVAIARQFLIKPEDMRKALGLRLGLGNQD